MPISVPTTDELAASLNQITQQMQQGFAAVAPQKPGLYCPLYAIANVDALVAAMNAYPRVPVLAAINPASGPGTQKDQRFIDGLAKLKAAGATTLGYLPTNWAKLTPIGGQARDLMYMRYMIDCYAEWYDQLDGLMLDEGNSLDAALSFYYRLCSYARSKGFKVLKINPGTNCTKGYFQCLDVVAVTEKSDGYPTEDTLKLCSFNKVVPRSKIACVVYAQPALDTAWLAMAKNYAGWFYVTDDIKPNPYDTLPSYLMALMGALDALT